MKVIILSKLKFVFIAIAMLQTTASIAATEETISLRDLIWNMEWAQKSVNDMTFTFVTATAKGSTIEKLNEAAQQSSNETLPEQTRMSVWIKKPGQMKFIAGDYKVIVRQEGQELFSYQYSYSTKQTARQKLPSNSWPVWPSPERIIMNLKKNMAKNIPYTIARDDTGQDEGPNFILTFKSKDSKEERSYVIRAADWQLLKSVFHEDGQPSFVAEWRDLEINTHLPDKVFDLKESKEAAVKQIIPEPVDKLIEILYAGVVKPEVLEQEGGYALANNDRYLHNRKFVDEKDTVPGVLGAAFGFVFVLQPAPPSGGTGRISPATPPTPGLGATVKDGQPRFLTARYIHPPMANALTREITTTHKTILNVSSGETQTVAWVFANDWEIVSGQWSMQLWDGNKKAAEKIFNVVKAQNIYSHLGKWGKRIPEFNEAIAKNSNDAKARNGLGNAYSEMGDYSQAISEYSKAIESNLEYSSAYNGRCDVYTIQKEFSKAIADCSKAIEIKPDYVFAFINRGKAYDGKNDYANALADYNKAIELNPRNSNAYFYRGLTLIQRGDFDGARADFEKTLELNPYDSRARKKIEEL